VTRWREALVGRDALHWPAAPATPSLAPNDVHVVALALDNADDAARHLLAALDPSERARGDRFRFARDRDRFLVGRAVLRGLLARYTGVAAAHIALIEGPRGKPVLAAGIDATLHFNVSHAGGLALLAVTRLGALGVDVEVVAPLPDLLDVADRFFAPAERATLRALPDSDRLDAFFRCWTRKEAYIKAIGEGLACPLDGFVVTMRAGEPARFIEIGDEAHATAWWLEDLRPAAGYAGALAIRAQRPVVRCWRWGGA
jgi:4'-phosphopantetheinyl transferase